MKTDEDVLQQMYSNKKAGIDVNSTKVVGINLKIFENPQNQTFDLPATILQYVLMSSSKIYEKLLKTCKYFYSKKRILLIGNVYLKDYCNQSQQPSVGSILPLFCHLSKIWVSHLILTNSTDPYHLSKFCEKIYKCTVCTMVIICQTLTENEFNMLVGAQLILQISLYQSPITKTNNDFLTCEEIVEKIPKAFEICFTNVPITQNTFGEMANINRTNKVKWFKWFNNEKNFLDAYSVFNLEQFKTFVTKCAAPRAQIEIGWKCLSMADTVCLERDNEEIQKFKNLWKPLDESPFLEIYKYKLF